jgi:hypothetical protein
VSCPQRQSTRFETSFHQSQSQRFDEQRRHDIQQTKSIQSFNQILLGVVFIR